MKITKSNFPRKSKENVQAIVSILFKALTLSAKALCYWLITTIPKKVNFALHESISVIGQNATSTQIGPHRNTYFFLPILFYLKAKSYRTYRYEENYSDFGCLGVFLTHR